MSHNSPTSHLRSTSPCHADLYSNKGFIYIICSCLLLLRVPRCRSLGLGSLCGPRQEKRTSAPRTRSTCALHPLPWSRSLLGHGHSFRSQPCEYVNDLGI